MSAPDPRSLRRGQPHGRGRARTADLSRVKRALSQLSYAPWDGEILGARYFRVTSKWVRVVVTPPVAPAGTLSAVCVSTVPTKRRVPFGLTKPATGSATSAPAGS